MLSRDLIVSMSLALIIVACEQAPQNVTGTSGDESILAARGAAAAKIKSVSVSPGSASIQAGATIQLTASTKPAAAVTFTWGSSSPSVATVSSSGLVTGIAPGASTITASGGGKSGTSSITVTAAPPPGSQTLLAAGDISSCANNFDEATAKLLDAMPGTVALLGDNVYDSGTTTEYNNCYGPTWGRHKARTRPSPGNHEYNTPNATGYYGYFGDAAGDPAKGYYSYTLGAWHIVVLNSNLARDATSAQIAWLRSDLTANTSTCTLAYWHHPRFSSGYEHGDDPSQQTFWDVLYAFNADVILNGHDHDYERFAPQNPSAVADASRGIREFVVGTGGRSHYSMGTPKANSEIFDATSFGVIKLVLSTGAYTWQFVPIAGNSFTDSGSGSCH